MNGWDIALILLLAAVVAIGVWSQRRRRKKGRGCCGDCTGCGHSCSH